MATEIEPKKNVPFEAFVERKIAETCRRIQLSEISGVALLLGSVLCLYALSSALFDLLTEGAPYALHVVVRWFTFALFLAALGTLGTLLILRVIRRVNPYYAARQLEQTVPGAKNSLINWLDLKQQNMHPAFRKNLSARASDDLKEADPEQTVDRKKTWWLLAVFTISLIGVLILLAARPQQFFSLLQRAFLPFYEGQLATQTRITMLNPVTGDAMVGENQAVTFVAQIEGRTPAVNQPGAPALCYRYQQGDAFVTIPLQQDARGHWTARLLADQVRNTGLSYKLTAGDAQTPEYQITVRSQPHVRSFDITYKHRPYLHRPIATATFPNAHAPFPVVKGPAGTEVTLVMHTNRKLRQAGVEVSEGARKKDLPTQIRADDPQSFQCKWVLGGGGHFRVSFTSFDGEENVDRRTYEIILLEDGVPAVVLTQPGADIRLPANGILELAGFADDDFGIKNLTLHMQLLEGKGKRPLAPRPYRPGKSFDLDEKGLFPDHVEYLDLVPLDELKDEQRRPIQLSADAALEYWLEATDNSDFPKSTGNVGRSKAYKVTILPPKQDDKKQQQDRQRAEEKQKQHAQKQDKDLANQQQEKEKKGSNGGEGQAGGDSKNEEKARQEAQQLEKELQDRVKEANKDDGKQNPGEAKGAESNSDKAESKPGANGDGTAPGEKKETPSTADPAGSGKEQSPPKDGEGGAGQAKDDGSKPPPNETKKPSDSEKGDQKQQPKEPSLTAKGAGSDAGAAKSGASKKDGGGSKPETKDSSTEKEGPTAQNKGDQAGPDERQVGKMAEPQAPQAPAQAKGADDSGPKSQEKGAGTSAEKPQGPLPQAKADDGMGGGEKITLPKADATRPTSGKADTAGVVKGDDAAKLDKSKAKEPTLEDVKHLNELLSRNDPLGDLAAKALTQISEEAPDPKVREEAKEVLDKAGKTSSSGQDPGSKKQGPEIAKKDGQAPKGNTPGANASTNDKVPMGSNDATGGVGQDGKKETIPGTSPGVGSTASKGSSDEPRNEDANPDFARRGGNLQLEDFLKKATPEYRKKAGITDVEWKELLDKAARYSDLIARIPQGKSAKTSDARGTASRLGGQGPREVAGTSSNPVVPLDASQAQPPPELIDAQRRFTSKRP